MKVDNDRAAIAVGGFAHWVMGLPSAALLATFCVFVVFCIATFWANWAIVKRAGHPGPMSLMLYAPCLSLFFLLWFAFTRWPVQDGNRTK